MVSRYLKVLEKRKALKRKLVVSMGGNEKYFGNVPMESFGEL